MSFEPLDAGPGVVQRLLPQRPPFLMVDRICGHRDLAPPALQTSRFLSSNEPFFQGHFPGLPLLPGALLIEGVAQTASLLFSLGVMGAAYAERGEDVDRLRADLSALHRACSLQPGWSEAALDRLRSVAGPEPGMPIGVAGSVRFKFLAPVTPGCRLDYEVVLTRRLGDLMYFAAEVGVNGALVARGTLAAAEIERLRRSG